VRKERERHGVRAVVVGVGPDLVEYDLVTAVYAVKVPYGQDRAAK
jgi:hypothetical protein